MLHFTRMEKLAMDHHSDRGVRYLTGETLRVVWAEFSSISYSNLLNTEISAQHTKSHF
jgi:hypothetical protein